MLWPESAALSSRTEFVLKTTLIQSPKTIAIANSAASGTSVKLANGRMTRRLI